MDCIAYEYKWFMHIVPCTCPLVSHTNTPSLIPVPLLVPSSTYSHTHTPAPTYTMPRGVCEESCVNGTVALGVLRTDHVHRYSWENKKQQMHHLVVHIMGCHLCEKYLAVTILFINGFGRYPRQHPLRQLNLHQRLPLRLNQHL